MGQSISAHETQAGAGLRVVLVCDGKSHNTLGPDSATYHGTDYILMRKRATADGWRRVYGGEWRGPCCKGGRPAEE